MLHWKRRELKMLVFDQDARLNGREINFYRWTRPAKDHAEQQIVNAFQRPGAAPDLQFFDRFPSGKGGKQPSQAQDVVQMAMRYEYSIEPPETDPGSEDLALSALTTVDQDAIVAEANNVSAKPAVYRRGRSRCA